MDRRRYFVHGVSCRLGEASLPVVNLSPGGLFASTNRPPPPGQQVEVELTVRQPPHRIRMAGRVRWTNDPPAPGGTLPCGFGLQIVRIEPEGERAIRDLLRGSNPLEGPPASW